MDSKEFGLVAAQQLLGKEDLHYGFWEEEVEVNLDNFDLAQTKHTEFLFKHIKEAATGMQNPLLLDAGCGLGVTTKKLLDIGYKVDGLVPSTWMADYANKLTEEYREAGKCTIYPTTMEAFSSNQRYDVIFFSESYQYVNMEKTWAVIDKHLTDSGKLIIFDFFERNGQSGKSPLGGGHFMHKFYQGIPSNYQIVADLDVTSNMAPNLQLVNTLLNNRIRPFIGSLDQFLTTRHKIIYSFVKWCFRKKITQMRFKLSNERNAENFIKYKSYRMITLSRTSAVKS